MKEKTLKYPLFFTFLLSVIILELAKQSQVLFGFDSYLKPVVRGILALVIFLIFLRYFKLSELFLSPNFNKSNFVVFIFQVSSISIFIWVLFQSYGLNWINSKVIVRNISISIFEEGMFRSICFGLLLLKFNQLPNKVIKSAIYSSLLFSSLHLINLIGKDLSGGILPATAFQLLYSFLLGLGFAGITYKTGFIFAAVILHTIINMYSDLDIFFPDDKRFLQNPINNYFIPLLCFSIIGLGIFYLLRKRNKDIFTNSAIP